MRNPQPRLLSRRDLLRLAGLSATAALAAACAPAAPAPSPTTAPKPTSAPPAAASPAASPAAAPAVAPAAAKPAAGSFTEADWQGIVAAAKQEGKFSVATYAGSGYRKVMEAFQEAFPGVTVEHAQFQSSSRDFTPRLLQELKAGIRTWDVALMPAQEQLRQTRPSGGLDPLRPMIVRPDVLDDSAWIDGFEAGFADTEKRWAYGVTLSKSQALWVNTDLVKDGEITKLQDLLDPKWKGKMIAADPRTRGSGFAPAMVMRLKQSDDDIIRRLFKEQEPTLTTDARQPTELMARGRYALALGAIDRNILNDFRAQGLGNNLKPVSIEELEYSSHGFNCMVLLKDAPHPAAAKLFINWNLTKEAAQVWAANVADNPRRADVTPPDPDTVVKRGEKLMNIMHEEMLEETEKTQNIAKEVLN